MRILFCALLMLALNGFGSSLAQRTGFNIYDRGGIPRSLQPSLTQRLNAFVEAQRDGSGEKLCEMLGPFTSGHDRREYKGDEREWIVQKLKERHLISFRPKAVTFTTAILNRPPGKRWWYIEGEGEFLHSGTGKVVIAPYRYNGEWYFQPMVVTAIGIEPLLKSRF
jgi:hypothetical protein